MSLLLLLTGEPPLPPPDLLEPLELVVADHALSLVVVDGSAAAEVADHSAAASVADNRTRVVETY